ncbi:hypothetical protein N9112_00150 [bacterium]|nr:hypothetical protein [bacterium]
MYGILENGEVIAKFVTPLSVVSNQPVSVSDTLSLKRKVAARSAQRWEISSRLFPLSTDANELFTHSVVHGHHTPFDIIVPQNGGVVASRKGSSSPTAVGTIGASEVILTGSYNTIPAGTFIKFQGHSKVYMVTQESKLSTSLKIFPKLIAGVSTETFDWKDDVTMRCIYDTSTVTGMSYIDGVLMDNGVISMVEYI